MDEPMRTFRHSKPRDTILELMASPDADSFSAGSVTARGIAAIEHLRTILTVEELNPAVTFTWKETARRGTSYFAYRIEGQAMKVAQSLDHLIEQVEAFG